MNAQAITEVYNSPLGCVYQDNRTCKIVVAFEGEETSMRLDNFLALKRKLDSIDVERMASESSRAFDYEFIVLEGLDKVFMLDLAQVLSLQELLGGAKFVMELNSVLRNKMTALPA